MSRVESLVLRAGEEKVLREWTRASSGSAGLAQRARILLLAEPAIGTYIDGWNEHAHPFTWTKGADEIISHAKPSPHQKKTYDPRH